MADNTYDRQFLKAGLDPGAGGLVAERDRQVGLADAGGAEEHNVLAVITHPPLR